MSKESILDCKIKLCLGRQGKNIFSQESFYLYGIFNNISEQDTSLLDCKYKHMMKSGAPPDKVGVLLRFLPIEFHGFTSRIELSLFGYLSYLNFFRDGTGPFKLNT